MSSQPHDWVISSPVGSLGLTIVNYQLTQLDFLVKPRKLSIILEPKIKRIVWQLERYFINPRVKFTLPLQLNGTWLQQKIWHAIQKISSGSVVTYGELARIIGTTPRVIGNACRANPLPIIIPCHRVVGVASLGGYGGNSNKGLKIKKWLLWHEHQNSSF